MDTDKGRQLPGAILYSSQEPGQQVNYLNVCAMLTTPLTLLHLLQLLLNCVQCTTSTVDNVYSEQQALIRATLCLTMWRVINFRMYVCMYVLPIIYRRYF